MWQVLLGYMVLVARHDTWNHINVCKLSALDFFFFHWEPIFLSDNYEEQKSVAKTYQALNFDFNC